MSDSYGDAASGTQDGGKVDAAKHEAGELKDTAAEQAGQVASTAKDEAASVAREAKSQVKDLYAQTQSELREQAGQQQQRVAAGLRSIGDELGGMASGSQDQGLATDLVRQASDRVSGVAEWLDARDPGSLLAEVKSFARRKPGTFIAIAALSGVVVGRLARSLAGAAADEKEAEAAAPSSSVGSPVGATSTTPSVAGAAGTDATYVTGATSAGAATGGASTTVSDGAAGGSWATPGPAADEFEPVAPVESFGAPATGASAVGSVDDTPLYTQRATEFGDDPAAGDRR
ncbi:hypothetical protein ACFJGV_09810 [Cnuibacter sp. UC19_7]|uniref:hypothetical protein n=1 Tax=Cnuibacter sp. UC19_7 TaxID=3350166 RepID=UPI00366EF8E8